MGLEMMLSFWLTRRRIKWGGQGTRAVEDRVSANFAGLEMNSITITDSRAQYTRNKYSYSVNVAIGEVQDQVVLGRILGWVDLRQTIHSAPLNPSIK